MLKRYSVYVTTSTTQRYEVIASSESEVRDLWADDPTHLQPTGNALTTEDVRIGQAIPFVEEARS